jgi:hypothetical protein
MSYTHIYGYLICGILGEGDAEIFDVFFPYMELLSSRD